MANKKSGLGLTRTASGKALEKKQCLRILNEQSRSMPTKIAVCANAGWNRNAQTTYTTNNNVELFGCPMTAKPSGTYAVNTDIIADRQLAGIAGMLGVID